MMTQAEFLARLDRAPDVSAALDLTIDYFHADSGSVHLLDAEGLLHLRASRGIPDAVIERVRTIPVGKGMAGLAVERRQPVDSCNIQTDTTGDVRSGARMTGMQGAIVAPMLRGTAAVGALGIATRAERAFSDGEVALLIEVGRRLAARS